MPTAETRIATDRAPRYLAQLCKHAAAIADTAAHGNGAHPGGHAGVSAQWTDTRGVITFAPYGTCTLEAGESDLVVRVEAPDDAALTRIRAIVGADLDRFGRRDGLTVSWT